MQDLVRRLKNFKMKFKYITKIREFIINLIFTNREINIQVYLLENIR